VCVCKCGGGTVENEGPGNCRGCIRAECGRGRVEDIDDGDTE